MSTKDVLLKHVVPIVGDIITVLMYGSPLKAVWRVRKQQSLGDLNPIPFPAIAANCAAWTAYSYIIASPYIFIPNALGLLLGIYQTATCLPFASLRVQDVLVSMQLASAALTVVLGAVTTIPNLSHGTIKRIWGFTANVILFGYYSSPLTVAHKVITSKDSSSLHWPLCIMNTIVGALWMVFGLAISDYFLAVPNGVGAVLALFSVILCFMYPRVTEQNRKTVAEASTPPEKEHGELKDPERGKQVGSGIRDTQSSPDSLITST